MTLTEVLDVSVAPDDAVRGAFIEAPAAGDAVGTYVLHVAGGVGTAARAIERIEIWCDGALVRSTRPDREEAEEAEDGPDGASPEGPAARFETLVGMVGLPLVAELRLEAVFDDGTRAPIGSVTARHEPVRSDYSPRLRPLLVTALPRTGTTWLMRLLGGHPEIVIYPFYPYEYTSGRYWSHVLTVLSQPANGNESATTGGFDTKPWFVGHNPFYRPRDALRDDLGEWLGRTYIERLAGFCQRSIDDWYTMLAEGQGKSSPRFFAEKYWSRKGRSPNVVRELYPDAREIFLVRDFRDAVCSRMSNDPERLQEDEERLKWWSGLAHNLLRAWEARGERSYLVRYEDLILRPEETFASLLDYVGVDSSAEVVKDVLARSSEEAEFPRMLSEGRSSKFLVHATSPSPEASVGRWHEDLGDHLKVRCDQVFGQALRTFGYPVGS